MTAMWQRWILFSALGLGGVPVLASAQTLDPEQEKARQLVERVRRGMREVDQLLLSGADSTQAADEIEANVRRIEELLREAESKSQSVVQGIEELIKMAKYQQSQNSQGGGGGGQQPKEQQSGQQPQREKSQEPEQLQQQGQPEGEDQQPEGGQQADSPRPDDRPSSQDPADGPPPRGERGQFERVDTTGRWGLLPPKEAEDLQRHSIEDFPQRYRPYMEMYYRRVNRLREGR